MRLFLWFSNSVLMQTKTCLFCCILHADKKIFKWCCGEYFKSSFCYKTYFVRQIDRFDFYYGTEQKINRRFARIETIELPYKIRKQVMLRRMLYNDAPRHFMSWCIDTESGICSKKCTSQSRKKEGSRESVIFL